MGATGQEGNTAMNAFTNRNQLISKWNHKWAKGEITTEELEMIVKAINFNYWQLEVNKNIQKGVHYGR